MCVCVGGGGDLSWSAPRKTNTVFGYESNLRIFFQIKLILALNIEHSFNFDVELTLALLGVAGGKGGHINVDYWTYGAVYM